MVRPSFLCQSFVWTMIWLAVLGTNVEAAQAVPETEAPLIYRRWLAPADRFSDWPFGEGKFFPYNRKLFEDWVSRLEHYSESPDDGVLSRIVLKARLEGRQLVDGQGFFDFRDIRETEETSTSEERRFPLSPLGLWISSPKLEDGTEAAISLTSSGETCLVVPETKFLQAAKKRVRFQWSLRSPVDTQGQLLFDFQLPRCVSMEILLDLPPSIVPSSPVGIILEEETERTPNFKRWRILLGGNSRTTITLSFDERTGTSRKTAAHQQVVYRISPQGMTTTTKVLFDKADPLVNDLTIGLESPLQPTEVKYGDQPVPWTVIYPDDESSEARIFVNLSDVERNDQRELSINAQAPYPTNRLWDLPRIRVLSSNIFWQESRGVVAVQRPLLANKLLPTRAIQVTPRPAADPTEWDVFAFQYFDADSKLAIDVAYFSPDVVIDSATQIFWGGNEVKGNQTLDVSLAEGDRYTLEFPISPRWTVDSVKSLQGDDIRSWDILDEKDAEFSALRATDHRDSATLSKDKILTILLKRPLRPKEGIRLQISGRYYPPSSQRDFALTNLVPLSRERKMGERHFIALNSDSSYQFKFASTVSNSYEVRDSLDSRIRVRFAETPLGTVFPLDMQTRDLRFSLEPLRPNYSAEILETLLLKEHEMVVSFRFRCLPTDSSVDRIFVHLTPHQHKPWNWSADNEQLNPLQTRRLSETEVVELLSSFGSRNVPEELKRGETWELRLAVPQSQAFEVRAETTIPLTQSVPVPLAFFPQTANQKAEIFVQSPREYFYQLINHRLTSIPIAASSWNRYQTVRAAFRYDPREEVLQSADPPLFIASRNPQDVPASAWIWSLRLDSQFEAEGIVRNTALFLVENRGKDVLRVTLPGGVRNEDVLAVWVDDVGVAWIPEAGTSKSIGIALPEGKRFVSVSLEYSFRDAPLPRQRKLYPRYPKVDVPVLSMSWTSWFPPDFDVCPKKSRETSDLSFTPKTINRLFTENRFHPFSRSDWETLLTKDQRRQQAAAAARIFFQWIGQATKESETKISGVSAVREISSVSETRSDVSASSSETPTWGSVLNDERLLAEWLTEESDGESRTLRRGGKGPIRAKINIDRQAVAALDVRPATPVFRSTSADAERRGVDAFDHAGLVLLVCPWKDRNGEYEYTFYITSFLSAAINRQPDSELLGNRIRFLTTPLQERTVTPQRLEEYLSPSPKTGPPQWSDLSQWIKEAPSPISPWSISSQIIRMASVAPDWTAFEMSQGGSVTPLYIVHRQTYVAYHWIAFLAVLALTWRRPFGSLPFLFLLLFVFEIAARMVAPCFIGIPGGAFLGTLVSLGFVLTRTRVSVERGIRLRERVPTSASLKESTVCAPFTAPSNTMSFKLNPALFSESAERTEGRDESNRFSDSSSNDKKNEPEVDEDSPSKNGGRPNRSTLGILIVCGFLTVLFFFAKGWVFADSPSTTDRSSTETSEGPIKREPLLETAAKETAKETEPYRVFFPIDDRDRIVGDRVWLTDEFLRKLEQKSKILQPSSPQLWRIDKAEYLGALSYDPLTQNLGLVSLKAVFEITLSTEDTTIQLPNLPLLPDGGKWDQMPIQPSWRADNSLVFNVENQEKGKHVLELSLTPPLIFRDDIRRVSMDIPKVPNTTFRLNVPPEASSITVADCLGTITPHSSVSSTLFAELGPSEKLTFSWMDEPSRGDRVSIEVDQLFKMRVRSGQVDAVDLRAVFRYRIDNGKVRQILLQTDPRWQLSGQFNCSEMPIEQVDVSVGSDGLAAPRREVTRLILKTPVSGTLTIEAAFVLKEFSGIGCVRLPQISALQARISKSLLAVSTDSSMGLDPPNLPDAEMAGGFDTTLAGIMETSKASTTTGSATTEDRPQKTYDLTKTDPSWNLRIWAKKPLPSLRLDHAVLFNYGEAVLIGSAKLVSNAEVFQQTLFAPESFEFEAIELKNAQNNFAEVRWKESNESRVIDGMKMKEYTLFFKRAMLGEYSITILGRFPMSTTSKETKRLRETRIPLLLFEDVRLEEQSLNLFRTKSVIVGKQTLPGWQRRDHQPETPLSFGDVVFLDAWKSSGDQTSSEILDPMKFVALTKRLPAWTVLPNEPIVRGEQISILSPSPTTDGWEMMFDFAWEITDGELETLKFHWDDRCGLPLVVEPPIPWKLEQKKGRSQLVFSPKQPLTGKQRLRIRTPFSFTGNAISFPTVFVDLEKKDRSDVGQYVVLPMESKRETIVWDLKSLSPVDASMERQLVAEVDLPWGDEKKSEDGIKNDAEETLNVVPRLFLKATGENATASIASRSNRPLVSLYDVGLFVKNNGVLYGAVTIDIQSRGHDGFVLRLPMGFDLIQLTCAGVASKGTKLPEQRWKIDLWSSDYPQRILVIFRGTLPLGSTKTDVGLLKRLDEERMEWGFPLPFLEGVDVRETLWTVSFEATSNDRLPRMSVSAVRELAENDPREKIDILGEQRPVSGAEATAAQLRLNLARLNNLLAVLETIPTPHPGKTTEMERWFTHWIKEWWSVKKLTVFQLEELAEISNGDEPVSILGTHDPSKRTLKTFIESIGVPKNSFGALLYLEEQTLNRLGLVRQSREAERSFPLPTNSLILWGESLTGHASHQFGVAEGQLKELRFTSSPDSYRLMERFQFGVWLWAIPIVTLLVVMRVPRIFEICRRFSHFWGLATGFGFWTLFPSSFLGEAIILLTLFSLVRPAWKTKNPPSHDDG